MFQAALNRFLRSVYGRLYHELAWAYDLLAAAVSLGRWHTWTHSVLPFVAGPKVLEIGYGTGHLFQSLGALPRLHPFGLDESDQMAAIVRGGKPSLDASPPCLTRGLAQRLPFAPNAFDSIVSTFPSNFILEPGTLSGAWRVLKPWGRMIVVPVALLLSEGPLERVWNSVFPLARTSPAVAGGALASAFAATLASGGFDIERLMVPIAGSAVYVFIATKRGSIEDPASAAAHAAPARP